MARPPRSTRHPALALGVVFALLLVLGTGTAWLLARFGARRPVRILLVTPPQGPASGLDDFECRALGALVQDHLECYGGCAVTAVTELPANLASLARRPHTRIVLLEPRRRGADLSLGVRSASAASLTRPGTLEWSRSDPPFLPPAQAFQALDRAFGIAAPGGQERLTPLLPGRFWDLIRATALRLQNDRLDEATGLAQRIVHEEPACASGWVLMGNLEYRRLLNSPQSFRTEEVEVEAMFRRALALVPGHPRAAFLLSLMLSDSGNQREALDLLVQARRLQPSNPTLLTGLAYAARGSGLLALARRALDLRDNLAFSDLLPQAIDITCLYTGETARFEASLQDQPGHLRSMNGVVPFYRGYLALVRGDGAKALAAFQSSLTAPRGYPNVLRLAEIYALILEDRKREAWLKLRAFDQDRTGMREPDGEFTLRLAEAYALLGDESSAMDMANRAFARGFGCTAWYERSPMLQPLHDLPRWQALLQHLRERQTLMEEAFPPGLVETPA